MRHPKNQIYHYIILCTKILFNYLPSTLRPCQSHFKVKNLLEKNLKILKCVTIYSIDINESLVANVITAKTYTKNVKESRKNEKER